MMVRIRALVWFVVVLVASLRRGNFMGNHERSDECHDLSIKILLWTGRYAFVRFRNGAFFVEDGLPVDVLLTPMPTRAEAELKWCDELIRAGLTGPKELF